jgi:TIR domain-containing protein
MGVVSFSLPVFVSYAHTDNESSDPSQRWLDRLIEMLKPLHLNDEVTAWSDRDIKAGDDWRKHIDVVLERYAHAAVLLVSPAFLASDFIRSSELPVLLHKRHLASDAMLIIPIVLRCCLYEETRFRFPDPIRGPESVSLSVFQSANPPDRPLDSMPRGEQDAVLLSVAKRLRQAYERNRTEWERHTR